jgi:hypothetical protein
VATNPLGPWQQVAHAPNGANCEPFFVPNGTVYFACPSGGTTSAPNCNGKNAFLSMSMAPSLDDAIAGRVTQMAVRTKLAGTPGDFVSRANVCFNWEDQNLWVDPRGNFHTLMHAYRGQPCAYPVCNRTSDPSYCSAVGGHAFSEDGRDWHISPVVAYSPKVQYEDGTEILLRVGGPLAPTPSSHHLDSLSP